MAQTAVDNLVGELCKTFKTDGNKVDVHGIKELFNIGRYIII